MKYIEDHTGKDSENFVYEPTFECILNHENTSLPSSISGSSRGGTRTHSNFGSRTNKDVEDQEQDREYPQDDDDEEWLEKPYKQDYASNLFRGVRRFLLCATILLLIAFGLILFFAVSSTLANNGDRSNNFAELNQGPGVVPTPAPIDATGAPTVSATDALTTTLSPTAAPTALASEVNSTTLVEEETAAPTASTMPECSQDFLFSEATCLTTAEPRIDIRIQNCQPQPGDWVGVWRVSRIRDPASLPEPDLWFLTCGSQDCSGSVAFNELAFGNLGVGTYEAHLIRLETHFAPYTTSYAVSNRFIIRPTC